VPYADFGDPQSLNLYQFVGGNPASKADPDGHCVWDACIVETGVAIGVGELLAYAGAGAAIGTAGGWITKHWDNVKNGVKEAAAGATMSDVPGRQYAENKLTEQEAQEQNGNGQGNATDPKKPGTLGKPDHQETAKEEAQKIGGKTEVKINTPGGSKDSRRADAAQVDKNGNYKPGGKIVQVIRPTKAGNVPKREKDAAQDIQNATGVKPELIPVRPLPKREDK
jgi:hypothetical protein